MKLPLACPFCFSTRIEMCGVEGAYRDAVSIRFECMDCCKIGCLQVSRSHTENHYEIEWEKMKVAAVGHRPVLIPDRGFGKCE